MNLQWYEWLNRLRPMELGQLLTVLMGVRRGVVEAQGMKFWVNPMSNFGLSLLKTGTYEKPLTDLLCRQLKPGVHFVDVGGNEGYFSILAAGLVLPGGMVYCVEPQKRLWKIIQRNIELNELDNVTLVPCAIGASAGTGYIRISPGNNTGLSSMVHHDRRVHWPRQRVEVETLDRIVLEAKLPKIKLMKIDVEGYEFEVLKSGHRLFSEAGVEYILVEVHTAKLAELGQSADDIAQYMSNLGYGVKQYYGYFLFFRN